MCKKQYDCCFYERCFLLSHIAVKALSGVYMINDGIPARWETPLTKLCHSSHGTHGTVYSYETRSYQNLRKASDVVPAASRV